MNELPPTERSWTRKFAHALRGCKISFRGESDYFVHFFAGAVVVAAAAMLEANHVEWCLLIGCVTVVLTAEMFNSSIERLAKAVDRNYNEHVRDALDIAAGGVLMAAAGAALLGAIILGRLALMKLGSW
jgi:diacylglycerol kinase